MTPNGKTVYVGNTTSASVAPIHVSTNSPLTDVPVGNGPVRMVITPNGRTLYTVNTNDNTVTPIRVSTNTAGSAIPVGGFPNSATITPVSLPKIIFANNDCVVRRGLGWR